MTTLTFTALPNELKNIANRTLGKGVLKSMFNYSYTYHVMVQLDDGDFVGFALYHLKKEREGRKVVTTGILDCVCVSPEYRGLGYGSLLTFGALRKMSVSGAKTIDYAIKAPPQIIHKNKNMTGGLSTSQKDFLSSIGFQEKTIYDNHYVKNSIKYDFKCEFCGMKPDSCSAFTYFLSSIDD